MATAVAYSANGSKQEKPVSLNAKVFELKANHQLLDLAYRAYLANGRVAGAKTLRRGEVRGGGKKPWRQKGTGRARVGSIRVPNWRGGGVVFGPSGQENYSLGLPAQMKRQAIAQALSAKASAKRIVVIEEFKVTDGKTKTALGLLAKLNLAGNCLVVVDQKTEQAQRATNNLPYIQLVAAKYLNVFTVMNADWIVITKPALPLIEQWLAPRAVPKVTMAKAAPAKAVA